MIGNLMAILPAAANEIAARLASPNRDESFMRAPRNFQQSFPGSRAAGGKAGTRPGTTGDGCYQIIGRLAVVEMVGWMTKYTPPWLQRMGFCSTTSVADSIRAAVASSSVDAVLMIVESPGGTVAGTAELYSALRNAGKPVDAYIEDLGASAAYYASCGCRAIYSNASALVGSIGVFVAMDDFSKMHQNIGIKTHVLKTGKFKGTGIVGAEITPDQLAEIQRVVDATGDMFVEAVAKGRRISTSKARDLADGRVHLGAEARALGLVDCVTPLEKVIEQLSRGSSASITTSGAGAAPLGSAVKTPVLTAVTAPVTIPSPPKVSAISAWNEAVSDAYCEHLQAITARRRPATEMEKWEAKGKAIITTIRAQPQLHAAYLKEFDELH